MSRLTHSLQVRGVTLGERKLFRELVEGDSPRHAAVLTGHFANYGLQKLAAKLANAAMLFIHSWWIVFPALVPPASPLGTTAGRPAKRLLPLPVLRQPHRNVVTPSA